MPCPAASRRPGSRPTKEGIYFGQCSELCGKDHAFMPIAVRVVKDQVFNDWAAALKAQRPKKAQRDHPRTSRSSTPVRHKIARSRPMRQLQGALRRRGRIARVPEARVRIAKASDMASKAHADHGARHDHEHTPYGFGAVAVLDQPQGHRHDVPAVRHHGRADRRLPVGRDAHGAAGAGPAVFRQRPHVQRVRHRARPHHGVLHGDAGHDRRLRQLVRAAA